MKKSKKISLLLVLAMILTSLVIPMSASAATTTLLTDSFDYADVDALKAVWGVDTNTSTTITPASIAKGTGADNSSALTLNRTTGTDWIMKHFATGIYDTGTVNTSFKMKHDYVEVDGKTQYFSTFIALANKNNNGKFLPAIYIQDGILYTGTNNINGKQVCSIENGQWYEVEFDYDLVTKVINISVSADGKECSTATMPVTQGVGEMVNAETMRVQLWGGENAGSVTIDDVNIVGIAPYLADNFNSYADTAAVKNVWGVDTNTSTTITPASIAMGTGADNSAALQLNRTTGVDWIMKNFKMSSFKSGVLEASFKMKHDYNEVDGATQYFDTFIAFGAGSNNSNFFTAVYINNGVLYTGTNNKYGEQVCSIENGQWYDVQLNYDIAEKKVNITVSADGTECGTASMEVTYGTTNMTYINSMRVQLWGGENAGSVTIDDVVIDDYVAPEVEEPITVDAENLGAFEGTDGSKATAFKAEMGDVTGTLNLTVTPSVGDAKTFEGATTLTEANVVLGLIINNLYDAAATAVVTVVE